MRVMRGIPSVRSMAAKLAIGLVATSVIAGLVRSAGISLYLVPGQVFGELALWQPISWLLLADSPMGVIFGALILWSIGTALEASWGPRRLVQFLVGVTFTSGLLTLLLALAVPTLRSLSFSGGSVMATTAWVAYGLSIGRGQTNFWGMPVSGNVLALIGVGFVALTAIFGAWQLVVPSALAVGMTTFIARVGSPRLLWLRFTSWRLQRRLKARSRHLRVIAPDQNIRDGSDRFLH